MAAILPAIKSVTGSSPSYGKPNPSQMQKTGERLKNIQGRRDRQAAEKSAQLRSQLPFLRKQDIAKYIYILKIVLVENEKSYSIL